MDEPVFENKLFTCSICKCAEDIGYCETDESDYFDLSDRVVITYH